MGRTKRCSSVCWYSSTCHSCGLLYHWHITDIYLLILTKITVTAILYGGLMWICGSETFKGKPQLSAEEDKKKIR